MNGPLDGLVVFDLTRILAGPHCTQILGDLGAEVIKIERPGAGDDTRNFAPPYLPRADGEDSSESAYFAGTNRNKRSVTLNLGHPEGQAIARRLIAGSDILAENFKTGTLAKYGLGYHDLKDDFPALIYCSVTGFGHTGPYAPRPAYDALIQAMGGVMSITGAPDGEPMKVGVSIADLMSGMYAAGRDPRRGPPPASDRRGPARRHLDAGRPRRVAREPGHELPRDRGEPPPARQPAPEHRALPSDAGGGRLLRAVGCERSGVRTVLRGGGLPAPARRRAVRDRGATGSQPRRGHRHPERDHPDPAGRLVARAAGGGRGRPRIDQHPRGGVRGPAGEGARDGGGDGPSRDRGAGRPGSSRAPSSSRARPSATVRLRLPSASTPARCWANASASATRRSATSATAASSDPRQTNPGAAAVRGAESCRKPDLTGPNRYTNTDAETKDERFSTSSPHGRAGLGSARPDGCATAA